MKKHIALVSAQCKYCGRRVMTASRSPLGLDKLKAEFGTVCSDCITPEEEQHLLQRMGSALVERKSP